MSEAATSYEARAVALAAGMLSRSAAWQSLVDVATAAEALGFVVDSYAGYDPEDEASGYESITGDALNINDAPAWALVAISDAGLDVSEAAIQVLHVRGTVEVRMEMVPPDALAPQDARRWATNQVGTIRSQMQDQVGTSDGFVIASVVSQGPFAPEEGDPRQGRWQSMLSITFEG